MWKCNISFKMRPLDWNGVHEMSVKSKASADRHFKYQNSEFKVCWLDPHLLPRVPPPAFLYFKIKCESNLDMSMFTTYAQLTSWLGSWLSAAQRAATELASSRACAPTCSFV